MTDELKAAMERALNNLDHGDEFTAADLRAILDSHAALLARLEAVTQERDELEGANILNRTAVRLQKGKRESAEDALAAAYRMGLEAGATVCNERGIFEQENYGLKRATQNYYRARDCIRALPDKTAAEILAQIEERGE